MANAHFRVTGRLDGSGGQIYDGEITIYRSTKIISVRRLRSRRSYSLPLSTVAEMVCQRVIRNDHALNARAKAASRKRRA